MSLEFFCGREGFGLWVDLLVGYFLFCCFWFVGLDELSLFLGEVGLCFFGGAACEGVDFCGL